MPITYSTFEVDSSTWSKTKLGDTFNGGTVIEGCCDSERDALLLVVRYGDEGEVA